MVFKSSGRTTERDIVMNDRIDDFMISWDE